MNPLRSVGARLTLALALLVAGALGVVYAIVVPSLEHNLDRRQGHAASQGRAGRGAPAAGLDRIAGLAVHAGHPRHSANARIVVYQVLTASPLSLTVFQDSNPVSSKDVQNDPVAQQAFVTGKLATGTVSRNEARYAEAAMPLGRAGNYVMLLTAPLHDSLGNVDLVQRRVLVAGLLALVAALLLGYGARDGVRAADPAARAGGRADRGRRLRRAGRRERQRRARRARRRVRADACPARPARRRPARVHRERLARAQDTDLLARRVPRAARRRGAGRADPARVPRDDARPGRPPLEAHGRPARPLTAGRGPAARRAGARGHGADRAGPRGRVRSGRAARAATRSRRCPRARRSRSPTSSVRSRSAGS